MDKVLLAIYSVKVKQKKNGELIKLDDEKHIDVFQVFNDYFSDILNLPQVLETVKNEDGVEIPKKKLTLFNADTFRVSVNERYIMGSFYMGESDSSIDVLDFTNDEPIITESDKDKYGYFRKFFFYLSIPESRKVGYIVIQKVGQHGMKGDFHKGFNMWFKEKGYTKEYSFHLSQVNNRELIEKLIREKKLKKFKVIRYKVPASLETSFKKRKSNLAIGNEGVFEISYKDPKGLNDSFKDKLLTFFKGNKSSKIIELGDEVEQTFDEIQYGLELNGKTKHFYLYKSIKMRSDRDVTNEVDYENGIPTEDSLVRVSQELIQDFSVPE